MTAAAGIDVASADGPHGWVPTCAHLRQTGPDQQRWLSVPKSRLALNPNNSTLTGGEVSQNSGPSLPLGANYIAGDWYNQHRSILQVSLADSATPPQADQGSGFPDVGHRPALDEQFEQIKGWESTSGAANLVSEHGKGVVTIGKDSTSGSMTRTLTVDLDDHPLLAVAVDATSDSWALKLHDQELDKDYPLQDDTDRTGVFVYDIAQVTGWSGKRTFGVKIYACKGGKGSTTTYDRVAVMAAGGSGWDRRARTFSTAWQPHVLEFEARYSHGSRISGTDHLHDADSACRSVDARDARGWVALAGALAGTARYDQADGVITVVEENLTSAVALPPSAAVTFSQAGGWDPSESPSTDRTYWNAGLRAGSRFTVGLGFAPGKDRAGAAAAAKGARDADVARDIARREKEFDAFLKCVPVPEDFALHGVSRRGITAAHVRSAYYRGWINLEQNVLPATPETGNEWPAIGTDKADNWMKGVPGAANVGAWDSLLSAQNMVHVDPEIAWSTLACILTQVQDDGQLDGQNLPSRFAQTLWVLYQVSGDRDQLTALYPHLARFLPWSARNPRWISATNDIPDEVNASYVVSLAYDLEWAGKCAEVLGKDEDVRTWSALRSSLIKDYGDWFFPADGGVLSMHYLEGSHPDATGDGIAETTALVLEDLPDEPSERITKRFEDIYRPRKDFAGLAEKALKAPHEQLTVYGLLARDRIDDAAVVNNSVLRDIVRSGRFAEVYHEADGTLGDRPVGTGVWPSTFGISNLIDAVWMNNGHRADTGEPTSVRFPGTWGRVRGLAPRGTHRKDEE